MNPEEGLNDVVIKLAFDLRDQHDFIRQRGYSQKTKLALNIGRFPIFNEISEYDLT